MGYCGPHAMRCSREWRSRAHLSPYRRVLRFVQEGQGTPTGARGREPLTLAARENLHAAARWDVGASSESHGFGASAYLARGWPGHPIYSPHHRIMMGKLGVVLGESRDRWLSSAFLGEGCAAKRIEEGRAHRMGYAAQRATPGISRVYRICFFDGKIAPLCVLFPWYFGICGGSLRERKPVLMGG